MMRQNAKPRQLNPAETAQFQADMARLPPQEQTNIALKWRERFVNAVGTQHNPVSTGFELVSAGVWSSGMGAWDGANQAARDAAIKQWREVAGPELGFTAEQLAPGGQYPDPFRRIVDESGQVVHEAVTDPRSWLGINRTLYPTFGLGLLAALGAGGVSFNRYLIAGTLGGVSYSAGETFRELVYQRNIKAHSDAQALAQAQQAGGNGQAEGNPWYGRYPRAA